ncbi:MAG: hypothetical protein ACYS8Z_15485 [Planctomycetota bacterium]|jgi:hypothetical protein
MTANDNIEQKLEQLAQALDSQDSIVPGVMSRIEAMPEQRESMGERQKNILMMRRILMNRFTKFAAAAVIIIAVILSVTIIDTTANTVLAETIRATHGVRYIHIKDFKTGESDPKEFWIEFFEDGEVLNARLNFPAWASADGEKAVVWKEGKAKVWFKRKNKLTIIKDEDVAKHLLGAMKDSSPRTALEHLRELEAAGKVVLEKTEPSIVTATSSGEESKPSWRRVLRVDQATKLVTAIEFYQLKGGEYEQYGLTEYHGYNEPIDASVFDIEDEVPAEAIRIDQTTGEIGLEQGQLSDDEIAVEVVRQFFEALIAADYEKASRIYSGVPAKLLEEKLAPVKFVRIVSIGEPTPSTFNNSLKVPCEYEIEGNGAKMVEKSGIYVRPVHGQPGRWSVDGGF